MLYGNKRLYNQTCSVKRGRKTLDPCLVDLQRRIEVEFGVRPLNVVYDHIDIGPHEGRPRLNLILESEDDHKKLHRDPFTYKNQVKKRVLRLFADAVSDASAHDRFSTDNVHLISDDFSSAAMGEAACQMMSNHQDDLIKRFTEWAIWDIVGFWKVPVVFFMDEAAKQAALESGISERLRNECYRLVKQYDEFDYFTPDNFEIELDSKENLDKNYEGNLYYYFK